ATRGGGPAPEPITVLAMHCSPSSAPLLSGLVTGGGTEVRTQTHGWVDPESGETMRIRLRAGEGLHGRLRRAGFLPVLAEAPHGGAPLRGEDASPSRALPVGT
ncbi:MAG: hypothetical protein O2799_10835, partial [Planctomycetota bacterium]|nr:hypothetical protein [Planctomycetota bacterium]